MDGFAMEKIPGGKLLKIRVRFSKNIDSVDILGDFFAHPEKSIKEIEDLIQGTDVDFDPGNLTQKIEDHVSKNDYQLIGLDPEGIVRVMEKAIANGKMENN